MSRFRALSSALALALVALAAPAVAAPARNLLANPGFEDPLPGHPWMPAGWDTSRAGLASVFFGRDTLLRHGGMYSADVANVSTLYYMAHNWSQRLPVGPESWGKDMVFSVWTRSNGLTGRAYILLQAYRDTASKMSMAWGVPRDSALKMLHINAIDDPAYALGWKRQSFSESETGWVKREVRVHIPPSSNVVFCRVGITGTGQVLLDDASLTLEPARAPKPVRNGQNLLAGSDFEHGLDDWEISMPPYEGMRVEVDTTLSHSGRASVRYESGQGEYVMARTGVCQVVDRRDLGGKRLRLTAYVKTDSLKGSAYAKIYCHTLRGVVQVPQAEQHSMNTDWTKTTLEMDVPPDTYLIWAWFAYDAPVTGIVHYDDCSLEVVGPARDPKDRAILTPR